MSRDHTTEKSALRAAVAARIRALSPAARAAASRALCDRIAALPAWNNSECVMLFMPAGDEPDITPLLDAALASIRLALPRVLDWSTGTMDVALVTNLDSSSPMGQIAVTAGGIRQPRPKLPTLDPREVDLVLVPGRAFDRLCNRLGRGKGFYDAFLRSAVFADPSRSTPRTIGVCFDEQVVPNVPNDPLDVPLDLVLTPTTIYTRPSTTT